MAKPKLSGYDLTLRLKKARNKYPLSAYEQALFYELVSICNDNDWDEVFIVPNDKIMANLRISENTLNKSRGILIEAGLVYYKSGKSKRQYSSYSFITAFEEEETTSPSTSPHEVDSEVEDKVDVWVDVEDYNKQEQNLNFKPINETIVSFPEIFIFYEDSKKNELFMKKLEEESKKIKYWGKIVEIWFNFYAYNFKIKPTFDMISGKSLKSLLKKLENTTNEFGQTWTEEYACRTFLHFLNKSIADNWRKENFRLTILNSHYDSIIKADEKQKSTSGNGNNIKGHQPFDINEVFQQLNSMYPGDGER